MELCQCVSLIQCANVCESPLVKDPINGCECLTLSEYLALFNHELDVSRGGHGLARVGKANTEDAPRLHGRVCSASLGAPR